LYGPQLIKAQQGFNYQAIVRDADGALVTNKKVSIRFSINQDERQSPLVYREIHKIRTNDQGLVVAKIGKGNPKRGVFTEVDWSRISYLRVDIDPEGGRDWTRVGKREMMAVPVAMYALSSGDGGSSATPFGLNVKDFGALGDNSNDDWEAIQATIDSASVSGNRVLVPAGVYRTSMTLRIPDGVQMIGEGKGAEILQTPYNGTMIAYEGTEYAVIVEGHAAGVSEMTIKDESDDQAKGGLQILADNRILESVIVKNILVSYFLGGTGLELNAKPNSAIYFSYFKNVRVRHAKIGYHFKEEEGGFINANQFYGGVVSGGGFDHLCVIEGGTSNTLNGTAFDAPNSTAGHFLVKRGEFKGYNIRVEAYTQADGVPLIEFKPKTRNSLMTGNFGGSFVLDQGNNQIEQKDAKSIGVMNSSRNQFQNPAFEGFADDVLPNWQITGTPTCKEVNPSSWMAGYKVLKLTVDPGQQVMVSPNFDALPQLGESPMYDQLNVAYHVKTDAPDVAFVTNMGATGMVSSDAHRGDGNWSAVGMSMTTNRFAPLSPSLMIDNTTGSAITVEVTAPVLSFGMQLPSVDPIFSSSLESVEGDLTVGSNLQVEGNLQPRGAIQYAIHEIDSIPPGGFLVFPRDKSVFFIKSGATGTITRINHLTADRFERGCVITLMFEKTNQTVLNSGYIELPETFNSRANDSIQLISMGNGTWKAFGGVF